MLVTTDPVPGDMSLKDLGLRVKFVSGPSHANTSACALATMGLAVVARVWRVLAAVAWLKKYRIGWYFMYVLGMVGVTSNGECTPFMEM